MTTIGLIFSILFIVSATVAIVRFLILRPLEDVKIKWLLIILTVVVACVGGGLLCGLATIPKKAETFMRQTAGSIENYVNIVNPEAATQPISPEQIRQLLDDRKRMQTYIDENEHIGFIVDMVASRSFLSALADFCNKSENMLDEFERTGQPLTVHNTLDYVVSRSNAVIAKGVARTQNIVLILTAISFVLIMFFYYCALKGWFTTHTSGVTFGEESDSDDHPSEN